MIEDVDLAQVRPEEYLSEGFLDASGEVKRGINGFCSLAVARRLFDAGADPLEMKAAREALEAALSPEFERDPDGPLSEAARTAIARAAEGLGASGAALDEVCKVAATVASDWLQGAALLGHLARINEQLALLTATNFESESDAD